MITNRRRWHISALAAAALIVAACGGGTTDSPLAKRVVVFGDSLSDVGAYTVATQIPLGQAAGVAPFFGGKWTTNTHTGYTATNNTNNANIWVEWIAARLGVALTPAEVGFGPAANRRKCPAAANPALAGSCTGYAQGGSRVTNPAGNGNPNGNGINGTSPAPMTVPMVTQVADHLAAFGGFSGDDVVFVFGGNNDALIQFALVAGGAVAPADAFAAVQTAATELATLVKSEIIAKGATRVAVLTLPDAPAAPLGATLPDDAARGLLGQLFAQFNTTLLAGLNGSSARIISSEAVFASVRANPRAFGLTNITTPACAPTAFNASGTSLLCNASPAALFARDSVPNFNGLAPGASASTYLFADSVHPTTAGHKIFADQVWTQLKSFGWVPENL